MDLQLLHERTGIAKRKLRYCLDHQLVPGLDIEIAEGEVGRPRKFAEDVGFAIVCAAKLLELGLKHETIRHFLGGLVNISWPKSRDLALRVVLGKKLPAKAELGDGVNVRLIIEVLKDSEWFAPGNPAKISADYHPLTTVTLDLGRIYQLVLGESW